MNFVEYYGLMMKSGDCDPSYPALNYVADRFELNIEQRYWLAFLYGCTYSVPTVFYIYNEFPDYENVDVPRLQRWWNENKHKLLFQTDRQKVKNFDLFVKIFESYRELMGESQQKTFSKYKTYDEVYAFASKIYYFGRFSLFNYVEALHELTDVNVEPSCLNLRDAESSRNGLCYAVNERQFLTCNGKKSSLPIDYDLLQDALIRLKNDLHKEYPELPVTFWNIETALCAYKKLFLGKRYLGYYVDRQQEEIQIMQEKVKIGVCWSVLWDFRKEFFHHDMLGELHGFQGIRTGLLTKYDLKYEFPARFKNMEYAKKVNFEVVK